MAGTSRWRWLLVGFTLFWLLPGGVIALCRHVFLPLLDPFMGFYPGTTTNPGFSRTNMEAWGLLWLVAYCAAVSFAFWKNSKPVGYFCIAFINLSSLLVIARILYNVIYLDPRLNP
jgi:hypothetical protein